MKTKFVTMAILLTVVNSSAQEITKDSLFIKYEESFKSIYNNEIVDIYNSKFDEYIDKINNNDNFICTVDELEKHLKEDLSKTKFKTVEEGIFLNEELNKYHEEVDKLSIENNKLFNELQKKYSAKEIFEAYEKRNDPFKI